MSQMDTQKEIAFYYPGPIWRVSDWIKTLLLFFDGVGVLLPRYMKGKLETIDPSTAIPLMDKGLLHVLEPERIIDKSATKQLAETMVEMIDSGAFDTLRQDTRFHEISYSRIGGYGDAEIATQLLEKLKSKGLAKNSEDGVSIPMHPMVRSLVLVLLSQILRPHGTKMGVELSPATDRPDVIQALGAVLSLPNTPSAGHVVALDLETVAVDLRLIPLDEILDFRLQHIKAHRAYVRSVRRFTRRLSQTPEKARNDELAVRREELQEMAHTLTKESQKAWKRPASFGLGMAGAFWRLASNDYVGAVLAASAALLGRDSGDRSSTAAYSYLFQASKQLR